MTTKIQTTKHETQLYREWQAAQQRVQTALGVLTSAQQASVNAEVAFKSATTLKYGAATTFEYDADKQRLTFKPAGTKVTKGD